MTAPYDTAAKLNHQLGKTAHGVFHEAIEAAGDQPLTEDFEAQFLRQYSKSWQDVQATALEEAKRMRESQLPSEEAITRFNELIASLDLDCSSL
jgi:hypothetical protein